MRRFLLVPFLFALVAVQLLPATPLPSPIAANPSLAATRQYWPTKAWRIATPDAAGLDGRRIASLASRLEDLGIRAMLIVHRGLLGEEWYAPGSDASTPFTIYSETKSLTSALVGVAVDRGIIKDIDQPISELLPGYGNRGITTRNLLSMTAGLEWPEWTQGIDAMLAEDDWVSYVLSRPQVARPGTAFAYSTGASQVLSAILQQQTGLTTQEFAARELFSKVGIGKVTWPSDPQGISYGGFGVQTTARDFAKFGFLYLNDGTWDGRRVLSADWIAESTRQQSPGTDPYGAYALHWWVRPLASTKASSTFFAFGYGGQYLFVVPQADLVVVFMSWLGWDDSPLPIRLLEQEILPALR